MGPCVVEYRMQRGPTGLRVRIAQRRSTMAAGHSSGMHSAGNGRSRRTFAAIVSAALLFAACQAQQPSSNPTTGTDGSPAAPDASAAAGGPTGELIAAV